MLWHSGPESLGDIEAGPSIAIGIAIVVRVQKPHILHKK